MLQSVDRYNIARRAQRQRAQQQAVARTKARKGAGKDFGCGKGLVCARAGVRVCLKALRGFESLHGAELMQRVVVDARLNLARDMT
jgi:hypothetical protein